jgi:hypothetical protein
MALQRLSTSSSQKQASAGASPVLPAHLRARDLAVSGLLRPPSSSHVPAYHARVLRLFAAAPHRPPGRGRSTPPFALHSPRPPPAPARALFFACSARRILPCWPHCAPPAPPRRRSPVISGGTGARLRPHCGGRWCAPSRAQRRPAPSLSEGIRPWGALARCPALRRGLLPLGRALGLRSYDSRTPPSPCPYLPSRAVPRAWHPGSASCLLALALAWPGRPAALLSPPAPC